VKRRRLALVRGHRLKRLLKRMLDPDEFLSDFDIHAISRYHLAHPYRLDLDGASYEVRYEPGEPSTGLFGGNSNRRGQLALSLEFLLGADILRTAIEPSCDGIARLAATAAIRTALNYFLQREIARDVRMATGSERETMRDLLGPVRTLRRAGDGASANETQACLPAASTAHTSMPRPPAGRRWSSRQAARKPAGRPSYPHACATAMASPGGSAHEREPSRPSARPSARHLPIRPDGTRDVAEILAQFLECGAAPEPVAVVGDVDDEVRIQGKDRRGVGSVQSIGVVSSRSSGSNTSVTEPPVERRRLKGVAVERAGSRVSAPQPGQSRPTGGHALVA
jgi:hypothetical protein